MGIERSVTLWYLRRQMLLNELALLDAQLIQMRTASEHEAVQPEVREGTDSFPTEYVEIEKQYKRVQEQLRNLGPCPKSMMG